jgi:hypothetical protein
MNAHDSLELELREMRPRGASQELKRRIVEQLESRPPLVSHRPWGIALASSLAAACLAAISLWWSNGGRETTNNNGFRSHAVSPKDLDFGPTVLAYHHALVRSPQDFNELLDKHSMVTLPHDPARNGIRAFIRPDTQQPSWTGEL